MYFGAISTDLAERIFNETGVDAENYNITRQAVRDNIKSGEIKLYDLENKLGLMKKMQKQEELVNGIISKLDSLNIQDKKTLESIKNDLKKLI